MRRQLTKLVNTEIRAALKEGQVQPLKFGQRFVDRHSGLVRALGDQLALEAVVSIVRQACKRAAGEDFAPLFPGFDDLPRGIAVPAARSRGAAVESDQQEPYYTGLNRATVLELRLAVDLLTRQINADRIRRNALRRVLTECQEAGAADHEVVADVLAGRRAA